MSALQVECVTSQDKLEDVITCCICNEIYRDPKILPCIHTFCMTCLQNIGTQSNKGSGDSVPCPLCRQEFKVPQEGFAALQKNIFMVRLIEITANLDRASSACDKHTHENLCLYCSDCEEVLCLVCLRECHQNHRLSDLGSAAKILRSQLQDGISSTANCCKSDILKKKERITQKKSAIVQKVEGFEREVYQAREDLKVLIDRHAESLVEKLSLLKIKGLNEIEIEEKEIDEHLARLEYVEKCCAELTSVDQHDGLICQVASELKRSILELELHNKSVVEHQPRSFEIHFTKTVPESLEVYGKNHSGNLIGEVKAKINYHQNPELVSVIRVNDSENKGTNSISGMTVSDNKMFILNCKNPVVSIYNLDTLEGMFAVWPLKDFVSEVDLRYCASANGNIYIVNGSREILQIDQNLDLFKWSIKTDWGRLSVSKESNVVLTCYSTKVLREYSRQGTLLCEIKLCSGITHPLHALKLGNGEFVVSHGNFRDDLNRVCIVNYSGDILKSFGERRGYSFKQLDVPNCLAVDEDGNILVLDRNNSRVLLLSSALEFKKELLTKANGLRKPAAMQLDEKAGRLYIADNTLAKNRCTDGRILIFNIK